MDQIEAYCKEKPADEEVMNLLKIEVYVCVASFLVLFLVFMGSIRRRCYNFVLKFSIQSAYFLSAYLISYTLGMMESFPFSNEMVVVWAVFLVIFFGSADSISVYSIEDNGIQYRYYGEVLVNFFWIALLILWHGLGTFKLPLFILLVLTAMKTDERARAMVLASKSQGLIRSNKLVADLMRYEYTLSNQAGVEPARMQEYQHIFPEKDKDEEKDTLPHEKKQLDIKDPKVITIQKIWASTGRLFSSEGDPNGRLKDICLSFALFKHLFGKFAENPWYECSHDECSKEKTWKFVQSRLLSEERGDHERAFRVIERELAFLYDLLYTKYAVIFRHKFPIYRIVGVLIVGVGCFIGLHIIRHNHTPKAEMTILTSNGHNMDYRVTGIVIFAILSMEVLQLIFILFSDWTKVMLVCQYVERPSWQKKRCIEKMIRLVCRDFVKPWERKLGQYSLLQSFDHNPCILFNNHITAGYLGISREGQKESSRIKLPVEVKKAVILSLKTNGRQLRNGVASLTRNDSENLSWACRLPKSPIEVILVWHIATSLCENDLLSDCERDENINAATSLSKYCAYLVAFHPRFLPGHAYDTELIFDQVVDEARVIYKQSKQPYSRCKDSHILAGIKPHRWKCEKCRHLVERCEPYRRMCQELKSGEGDHGESVVKYGAKLGKSLIEDAKNPEHRWKVLADFWAEMMLFVSPSDDASIHAERLAAGGEFITHLWALLAHAGILKRDDDSTGTLKQNNDSTGALKRDNDSTGAHKLDDDSIV